MLSAVKLISSFVGKGFSSKAEESADVSKKNMSSTQWWCYKAY